MVCVCKLIEKKKKKKDNRKGQQDDTKDSGTFLFGRGVVFYCRIRVLA